MTDTKIPACHYDRALGYRVTSKHSAACAGDNSCPGRRGCAPCEQRHCAICAREHSTQAQPQTCPECQGKIDDDLVDIQSSCTALSVQAVHAGHDGKLVAAAPIPGGDAQVLIGPTVRVIGVRYSRTIATDHRKADPLPPLAVLTVWEDTYRNFLGHDGTSRPPSTAKWGQQIAGTRRATIGSAVRYLRDQLPYIAQRTDGPDFLAFTRQVRKLRASLEQVLHDEREPERGVECFECGDQLVRRYRDARRCRHRTDARRELQDWLQRRAAAQDWLRTVATYPELGPSRVDEVLAATRLPASLLAAARVPCGPCSSTQGGIDDPRAGRSWECPGCRKQYDVGEYATAIRRSLVDEDGDSGDHSGWCILQVAAAAAADITGRPVSTPMIRMWIARGDDIGVACVWHAGARTGVQVVYWPDVLHRATEVRSRRRGARGAA